MNSYEIHHRHGRHYDSHRHRHLRQRYHRQRTPLIFWPFVTLWRLVTGILGLVGRLVALVLGLVLVIVGVVLSLTIIGAVIGIPVALVGMLLMVRSIF